MQQTGLAARAQMWFDGGYSVASWILRMFLII